MRPLLLLLLILAICSGHPAEERESSSGHYGTLCYLNNWWCDNFSCYGYTRGQCDGYRCYCTDSNSS